MSAAPFPELWPFERTLRILLFALSFLFTQPCRADIAAAFNSPTDVAVTASSFLAGGETFNATLNFAPSAGTNLTVVKNTGPGFIDGTFSNLAQGQEVILSYGGINYRFIANYYGGSGNDLVLQWAKTRPVTWGSNFNGQIGDNSTTDRLTPVDVLSTGVLAGKTIISAATGESHSLALCSDGTIAAWGANYSGQLGNGKTVNSPVPVAVNSSGVLAGKTVVAVAAGHSHSLALCSDGTVAAWGADSLSDPSNGTTTKSSVPVAVNIALLDGKTVVAIAAGGYRHLALCSDGTVVAWVGSSKPVLVNTAGVLAGKNVVAVAAGASHSLALCSDGTVAAWGDNLYGELGDGSTTMSNPVPVAVNTTGVLAGKAVIAVAAGYSHSLALCSDGTLVAWGRGEYGQLGDGNIVNSPVPVAVNTTGVLAGKTVVDVATGSFHSLVRCSDGSLAAWGLNNSGPLGNNSTTFSRLPVGVSNDSLVNGERYASAISGSTAAHNLALVASPSFPVVTSLDATGITKTGATLNGTVNPDGTPATAYFEYGLTTSYGSNASIALSPNDGFRAQNVSVTLTGLIPGTVYHYRVTVVTADHTVSTADGTFATARDIVASFHSGADVLVTASDFSAVESIASLTLDFAPSVGTNLTVVKNTGAKFINGQFSNLTQGQEVVLSYRGMNYRFIANYYGGTGNDLVLQWARTRLTLLRNSSTTPPLEEAASSGVLAGKTVVSAATGKNHSLALCSDGTVAAWGDNLYGQLGNTSTTNSLVPVAVSITGVLKGKTVVAVAAGSNHSLALCSDGTVAAWGNNQFGQLGNNSTTNSSVPVAVNTSGVLSGKTVIAMAAGSSDSLVLCADGTISTWGINANSLVPIAVNTGGALSGKTAISVAMGYFHRLALCSDGTVAAWGSNSSGELGNNSTTNSSVPVATNNFGVLAGKAAVAIAAGKFHNLGLCSDGTIAAWGDNLYGQLGNNSTTDSLIPTAVNTSGVLSGKMIVGVAAGSGHSLAYCSDGTIAAWGGSIYSSRVPVSVSNTLRDGERYIAAFSGTESEHSLGLVASPYSLEVGSPAATNVTRNSVTLSGRVNPDGSPTAAYFEYGLDTSYGNRASVTLSPSDGIGTQNVSTNLTGLTPGTIYHYRLTAENAAGIASTVDGTFATSIDISANFNSASDVAFTTGQFSAEGGASFSATLNFAPSAGTNLTVVKNTGLDFIHGRFDNLAQGQVVTLTYGGINYRFVANYFGGSGNDLVLQWANTRPVAWGANVYGQIGDNSTKVQLVPTNVVSSGVLAGKTIISAATGGYHSLALCSDGTIAAWGSNNYGQLGNGSTTASSVPVAVVTAGVLSGKTVVAVAAGSEHSLALCSDGTVAAWGYGVPTAIGKVNSTVPVAVNTAGILSGKTVVAIAAVENKSFALCSDGTIATWEFLDPAPTAFNYTGALAGKTVVAIATGYTHTLALCSDGTLVAWGGNGSGQLGNNNTTDSSTPVAVVTTGVLSGKTIIAIAAGYRHSLALCSDGTVAAWGSNIVGELGNNSTISSPVPVAVTTSGTLSGKTVIALTAGSYHSLAVCNDGTVASWGYNPNGELGVNSTTNSSVPVAVTSNSLAKGERYIAAFSGPVADHNLALIAAPLYPILTSLPATNVTKTAVTLNGSVDPNGNSTVAYFEYGFDTNYGSSASVTLSPDDSVGGQNVSAVLTGIIPGTTYHYRLRAANIVGTVSTSDGTFTTPLEIAATYKSASDVPATVSKAVAAGGTFNVALNFAPPIGTNLTVVKNTGADFIHGTFSNLAQGQVVTLGFGGIDYRFVANYYGGTGNDLVLQWANSRPVAWGTNSSGQVGDSSTSSRRVPVDVLSTGVLAGKTVISTAVGGSHSLALCSDGTVAAWGSNSSRQLGNDSTTNSSVPVAVNTSWALSGKTVVAVSAGYSHSLALCSDGTVAAWGSNSSGQLGNYSSFPAEVPVPVNASGALSGKTVVAVSAGYSHSLALCSDGTVAAWGSSSSGQLGNNNTTSSSVPVAVNTAGVLSGKTVVAVSAGQSHSLALCDDGMIVAWGDNFYGQLGNNSTTNRWVPVAVNTSGVLSGKTVIAVAAGSAHSLALCSNGTVAAWGSNSSGQLGNNSTTQSRLPVLVNTSGVLSGKKVVAVTAGGNHSLALCSDGTAAAWGNNFSGQLGNNSFTTSTVPAAVSSSPLATGECYMAVFSGSNATHSLGLIAAPPAPVAISLAATNLTSESAKLNGTVNAASGSATVYFDFGLDSSYGSTVSGTPSPVTGNTDVAVSANVTGLSPNTTYHYRVRAINSGGTATGEDLTFTTLPDTASPKGGSVTLTPGSPVEAGAAATVTFSNWKDQSLPLTYSVLIDDVLVSAQGASAVHSVTAPATAGTHTLKGRIYDALGHVTEVVQNFTVIATQEEWRTFYFGTAQNAGNAADLADLDGDGANNLFEYVAGLVPTNPLSRFDVRIEAIVGYPGQKAIIFGPLAPGRIYTIKYKASLTDEVWMPLTDIMTSDNGAERTITDLSSGNGSRFYRVEITRP